MKRQTVALVRARAEGFCAYCRYPEAEAEVPHALDHVIAVKHHGSDSPDNLALCCRRCNEAKEPTSPASIRSRKR